MEQHLKEAWLKLQCFELAPMHMALKQHNVAPMLSFIVVVSHVQKQGKKHLPEQGAHVVEKMHFICMHEGRPEEARYLKALHNISRPHNNQVTTRLMLALQILRLWMPSMNQTLSLHAHQHPPPACS
jgi:hypothetical protein